MNSANGSRYSQHSFAQVPDANTPRSSFDRSFTAKDTMDFDYLTPFFVDEILPGDTVKLTANVFARLATQLVPILDNMYMDFFFFWVPSRLLWDNWEQFNHADYNPNSPVEYTVPQMPINTGTGMAVGTLWDKFGLPTDVDDISVSALPFRAYNLIWNEWFRDSNTQGAGAGLAVVDTDNGPDAIADYVLLKANKPHDYFTSALPWQQKTATPVMMALSGDAPVMGIGVKNLNAAVGGAPYYQVDGSTIPVGAYVFDSTDASGGIIALASTPNSSGTPPTTLPNVYTDISNLGLSIDEFRMGIMMQSLFELDGRGGTRYVELIRSHWNVVLPDFTAQRPEFLSAAKIMLSQNPVAQTSGTPDPDVEGTPQANLAAFTTGTNKGNDIGFNKSFSEHGYVMGLCRARGEVTYQQGINRFWSRSTRYDYFWPKLQQLSDQGILYKEIYAQGNSSDDLIFGYQERYGEYRFRPSEIRGQFRSTYAQSLDVWHLAEEFTTLPNLITIKRLNTPIERVLAVTEGYPHLLVDYFFKYHHTRVMMSYGVPATLGQF